MDKIKPLKKFSQNFLTNDYYQKKIIDALNISQDDIILEIGPGTGVLTQGIVNLNPGTFYVVEIDNRFVDELQNQFGNRIELFNKDILNVDFEFFRKQNKQKLKIIGNLPYHITSPIIFKLVDSYRNIQQAVIMIQKEVAKRVVAQPRTKDYGILSVTSQAYSSVEYLFDVTRGNFNPVPDVDSAIVRYTFYNGLNNVENEKIFRQIIRGTFNYRRKMLRNSLGRIFDKSIVYSLPSKILEQRPEELSVDEFKALSNKIFQRLRQDNA